MVRKILTVLVLVDWNTSNDILMHILSIFRIYKAIYEKLRQLGHVFGERTTYPRIQLVQFIRLQYPDQDEEEKDSQNLKNCEL